MALLAANTGFTALSLELGAPFYGYGLALTLGIAVTYVAWSGNSPGWSSKPNLPR